MKVYVVKETKTWRYLTETNDFINDLRQASLFLDYEIAQCYCPSGCEVVEVQLMETKSLADYTKQVRKEVLDKVRRLSAIDVVNKQYIIETEILDQIQGEDK